MVGWIKNRWMDRKKRRKKMDGWKDKKNEMDGWMAKNICKQNRWMVGWIQKYMKKIWMVGWKKNEKNLDGWLDGQKINEQDGMDGSQKSGWKDTTI